MVEEAMSVVRTPWNSWRGENLSIEPKLIGADLSKAILVGATLTGADLSTASLTEDELEPATGGENTRLPPDLDPPRTGE